MRVWFFSSPVIWFMDMIPPKWHWAFKLNPMYHILGWYRDVLINNRPPDFTTLLVIGSISLICILPMIYYYRKNEHLILKSL